MPTIGRAPAATPAPSEAYELHPRVSVPLDQLQAALPKSALGNAVDNFAPGSLPKLALPLAAAVYVKHMILAESRGAKAPPLPKALAPHLFNWADYHCVEPLRMRAAEELDTEEALRLLVQLTDGYETLDQCDPAETALVDKCANELAAFLLSETYAQMTPQQHRGLAASVARYVRGGQAALEAVPEDQRFTSHACELRARYSLNKTIPMVLYVRKFLDPSFGSFLKDADITALFETCVKSARDVQTLGALLSLSPRSDEQLSDLFAKAWNGGSRYDWEDAAENAAGCLLAAASPATRASLERSYLVPAAEDGYRGKGDWAVAHLTGAQLSAYTKTIPKKIVQNFNKFDASIPYQFSKYLQRLAPSERDGVLRECWNLATEPSDNARLCRKTIAGLAEIWRGATVDLQAELLPQDRRGSLFASALHADNADVLAIIWGATTSETERDALRAEMMPYMESSSCNSKTLDWIWDRLPTSKQHLTFPALCKVFRHDRNDLFSLFKRAVAYPDRERGDAGLRYMIAKAVNHSQGNDASALWEKLPAERRPAMLADNQYEFVKQALTRYNFRFLDTVWQHAGTQERRALVMHDDYALMGHAMAASDSAASWMADRLEDVDE